MTKKIAVLVLTLGLVPANATDVNFDTPGRTALPMIGSIDIPVHPVIVHEATNPLERFASEKIVGGMEAVRGEFPFIVSLRSFWGSHFCGGSLIKKNWVLTAAHCVESGYLKGITIGLHNQADTAGVENFTAAQIIKHPGWNEGTMENDFALVKLSSNSKFTPIALNDSEISSSVDLVTAGWGTTSEGGNLANNLMKVTVPFVDHETCLAAYPGVTESMICAGYPEGGKDSCQGDSGGPLLMGTGTTMKLVGVVSWGEGCARPGKYGVYSKVNYALDWIKKTIN